MSHSMLNRQLLSAQARGNTHPYARHLSHSHSPPAHPHGSHSPPAPVAVTAAAASHPAAAAPLPPPAAAGDRPIASCSYTAAALARLPQHDTSTAYSLESYPTVPLQTAKQRAQSVKKAAREKAAAAASAANEESASNADAAAIAAMAANQGDNPRRPSTISLEDMLSDDEEGSASPATIPFPWSFFDLDSLSMASNSALMAEIQFLAGNPPPTGPPSTAPPPPPPPPPRATSSRVSGSCSLASHGDSARSTASYSPSLARARAPSSATHDRTVTSKSSSSASASASASAPASSSSASVEEFMYSDLQHLQPSSNPLTPPSQAYHDPKRPSPTTSTQQLPTAGRTSVSPALMPADQSLYPAPPTHDTSTLGSLPFDRQPLASELNLTAAAQSYQAQRAAYEYVPTSTAVTGANAEDVLSVPFLPEISYLTNPEGDIVSVEDAAWNSFIDKNNTHPFLPRVARCCFPQVMGRSLFEFLRDPKLARFTRHLLHMVSTGTQPRLTYHWFCDSPTVERKMAMSVSRLTGLNNQPIVLWSSKILFERDLPVPASYLALPATHDDPATNGAMPCCSYCKRVMVYLSDLTLTPELVASLMSGSPNGSPNVLNPTSTAHQEPTGRDPRKEDPASATATGRNKVRDLPEYEPHGLVPIFGLRGKRGVQEKPPFSSVTTHVWLTPTQYSLARVSAPASHVYHGVCEVCWGELVSFFGL